MTLQDIERIEAGSFERAVGAYIRATERAGGMADEPERLNKARAELLSLCALAKLAIEAEAMMASAQWCVEEWKGNDGLCPRCGHSLKHAPECEGGGWLARIREALK